VTADPLVDAGALAASIATDTPPTVLDVRWTLGGPSGAAAYAARHLPGAVFLDLDSQLCGPPGARGRHPLPDPDRLTAVLRAAGVRDGHPVVVYDAGESEAARLAAPRAWWTLRWAGIEPVRVLNGGFAGWVAAGHPVSTEPPVVVPGDVTVRPGSLPVLDAAGAAELAAEGVLIDVRAPERYRGEREPIDPVAGHIPGAVNLPVTTHLAGDGRCPAPDQLRELLRQVGVAGATPAGATPVGATPVGVYCGSGVNAAHTVLALHLAGRPDAALYVGSWSHWVTDPDRPVATGEAP
jgi:thiosulfate/3-mercaptopyruvate sulfurtransferase